MTQVPLFDGYQPDPTLDTSDLSADQRRTRRQKALIEAGINPGTGRPILKDSDETCGSCGFLRAIDWHNKTFFKCELVEPTHGPGTDIRKWWPACESWAPTRDATGGALVDELLDTMNTRSLQ